MAKRKGKGGGKREREAGTCRVEAVVGVDERGQMVLPKDVRERLGVGAGEKLALVSWERDGRTFCLSLMRVTDLAGPVREVLGPSMKGLL